MHVLSCVCSVLLRTISRPKDNRYLIETVEYFSGETYLFRALKQAKTAFFADEAGKVSIYFRSTANWIILIHFDSLINYFSSRGDN